MQKIYNAAYKGDLQEIIKLIEENGNDKDEINLIFQIVSEIDNLHVIEYLVKIGADITIDNNYALICASSYGHLEVVKYLVSLGADIHAENDCAVGYAADEGKLDVVKYLVSLGANIRADDNYALRRAIFNGHYDVIKYLLINGAYYSELGVDYCVIYDLYCDGHFELVNKLITNNNCIEDELCADQLDLIKKSIAKIFFTRNWYEILFNNKNYIDIIIK